MRHSRKCIPVILLLTAFVLVSLILSSCRKNEKKTDGETTPTVGIASPQPTYTPTPFVTIAPVETDVTARAESIIPRRNGEAEKIWDRIPAVPITKKLLGTIPEASFQLYWDEWNLYARVMVMDSTEYLGDKVTTGDCVTFYVNESNSHVWRYGVGDYYLNVSRKGEIVFGTGCNTEVISGTAYEIEGGYVVEMLLPFISILGKENTRFGFDVCVNDFADGKNIGRCQWSDTGWHTETSTEWVGTVVMCPDIFLDESEETFKDIKGMQTKAYHLPKLSLGEYKTDLFDIADSVTLKNIAYGKDGAAASYQALYDSDYLYLKIRVEDATEDTKSNVMTRKDSVELFLTADGEKPGEYRSGTDMHFRIARDGMLECGNGASDGLLTYTVDSDANGYTVLCAVRMPSEFKTTDSVGFDLHVNDSFGSAMRDYIVTWSDTSLRTNTDLTRIGTITLK